jgi:hypothetical protein
VGAGSDAGADMSGSELSRAMSRHALSERTLDAIVEIDRALARLEFDPAPVQSLGRALLESSAPQGREGQFNLVEPEYFHPFERLFRERRSTTAQTIEEIRSFVHDSASSLFAFQIDSEDDISTEQLRAFCVALHRQLIVELRMEDAVVIQDGWGDECTIQASLRTA